MLFNTFSFVVFFAYCICLILDFSAKVSVDYFISIQLLFLYELEY